LSIFKGTEESIIEDSKSGLDNSVDPELYRFNNNDRGRWARSWGQILSVSMPVKTKA
jgi:hypothetical protein